MTTDRRTEDQRIVRRLNSLLDVSKAMAGAIDLDSLLAVILTKTTEVMEAERASIFILDEKTQTLWNRASGELGRGEVRIPVDRGLVGHVFRTGELLNIPDAHADPRFNPDVDRRTGFRTRSVLCAPLTGHSAKLIGVIQVLNKRDPPAFTREDETLLEALASHAALALDRARLVEAVMEKERMDESLRLAYDIQMGMLPKQFPQDSELDMAAEITPARSVGGDLYDFLVEGRRLSFLIGDVAGKGVPAALFMAVARTLFRANLQGDMPLSVIFSRVNRELCLASGGAMFVTVFAARLDLGTGEMVTGNAGHNPPYHLGREGLVPLREPRGIPLGVLEAYEYETGLVRLEPGDGVYLYTDGITEALNEKLEQFTSARLEAFLRRSLTAPASDLVQGSLAEVRAFVGETPQSDDLAVMAVRYRGPGK